MNVESVVKVGRHQSNRKFQLINGHIVDEKVEAIVLNDEVYFIHFKLDKESNLANSVKEQ